MSGVFRHPSRVFYERRQRARRFIPTKGGLGRAVVTVTGRALSASKVVALGRAVETSTGRAVTYAKTVALGQATITHTAGAVTSASTPGGTLLPELIVEVAFVDASTVSGYGVVGDATRGVVGTAKVAGAGVDFAAGTWTDITAYVMSGTITRGSSRVDSPLVSYEAGTCTIVLRNDDRRFDETHLGGPYVSGETSLVTPMRPVRVRARWDDTVYELFQGFADDWDVSWEMPNWSQCVLTATDAFKVLSNVKRPAVAATGAGDDAGARITRILNSANWPATDRMIDTGDVTLQATTLDGDALTELRLAADSELGELYVDGGGRVTFRRRSALTAEERSAISQAEFGDGGGTELPFQDAKMRSGDGTFYNSALVTAVGGAQQSASSASSIATYLERTFERSDLIMQTDAQALSYARTILARSGTPERRFDTISIDPRHSPTLLYPQVFGRQLADRITIVVRPPGGGNPIRQDVYVRGVEHIFEPMQWDTKWSLQKALDDIAPPPRRGTPSDRLRRHHAALRHDRFRRPRVAQPPVRWR